MSEINLDYLIETFNQYDVKGIAFFNSFFDKLAGSNELRIQIESGWSSEQIKETWQEDLNRFRNTRTSYLIYP